MRPYFYSLSEYLKDTYGTKMYKLALNGGMTCPNRDGLIDTRGCIFCSAGGSGEFAGDAISQDNTGKSKLNCQDIRQYVDFQINAAKNLISAKYNGKGYIAYFQAFTNTYGSIQYLRELYTYVINRKDIKILSIATRPDCINHAVLALIRELNAVKPVWIELGLQTIHARTASYIRRGYPLAVYDNCIDSLNAMGIHVITHMIIGLPGENKDMILETAKHIADCHSSGIKLQLLHVLKGTDLAKDYYNNTFATYSLEEYAKLLGRIIENLPESMVIHRLTGDGPKQNLIAPSWTKNKKYVYNYITNYLKTNHIIQGSRYT